MDGLCNPDNIAAAAAAAASVMNCAMTASKSPYICDLYRLKSHTHTCPEKDHISPFFVNGERVAIKCC